MTSEAQNIIGPAAEAIRARPDFFDSSLVVDAEKEYAEAVITIAILSGEAIPTPSDLNIGVAAYMRGLAEAASELRRAILDRMRSGDSTDAQELLDFMDDVYGILITFDFPEGVTKGLRRTTDQLRPVLERTRSDVTIAVRQMALEAKLDATLTSEE